MRNLKLFLTITFISALLLNSFIANANSFGAISSIKVVKNENGEKSIAVRIPYADSPKVEVNLRDANGILLYNEYAKVENGYAKQLNLKKLPNGVYTVSIEDDSKLIEQEFRVEYDMVIMDEYPKNIIQKPVIQHNLYQDLILLDIKAKSDITVKFLSEDGNELLLLEGNQQIEKVLKLNNLNRGHYTIVVQYDGETFYENISVK